MFVIIMILLFIAQFLSAGSNYINRFFPTYSFLKIFAISSLAAVLSNCISFPTLFYLGKSENVIILACLMLIGTSLSAIIVSHFILQETVHIGSYITLFGIVSILFIHNIVTKNYYDKLKELV